MSGALTLREIARIMGGEVTGQQVLCPGPGHRSPRDRSLSVRLSHQSPTGWITHSYVGDPFDLCRDFVAARLGLPANVWRTRSRDTAQPAPVIAPRAPGLEPDSAARIARARAIFDGAGPAAGTIVEHYLAGRGLRLDLLSDPHAVIRYDARAPWRDDATGEMIRVPAMICAMRSITDDSITAVHKTRLTAEGHKVGRKMQGRAASAAIKLSEDASVEQGVTIGEGVETTMTGMLYGLRPAWAVGSADAIAKFPLLPGLDGLTILGEAGPANAAAVEACGRRWAEAGREVIVIDPVRGSDINDSLREAL